MTTWLVLGALLVALPPTVRAAGSLLEAETAVVLIKPGHRAATLTVKALGAGELLVTWQGCAEAGLCYQPETRTVTLAATSNRGVQHPCRQATVAGRS